MRRAVRTTARDRALLAHIGEVVMYLVEAATNPALLANAIANAPPSHISWPPVPVPAESSLAERVLSYGTHEVPRKFEKLAAIVAANANLRRKTLVWSNFVINLEELAQRVLAPYQPALIYGAIPSSAEDVAFTTRESELRRFREDERCMVLLANPAAMSEGVSLHEVCHDAVYLDRTFNAGQYLQSLDRIHRLGLTRGTETRISFLVSAEPIDETVDQRVRIKAERLSQMLSDPNLVTMALPDDEAYGEWIDTEDLDALFAHLDSG
jgi:SNF2 family DNA or RNA helicase